MLLQLKSSKNCNGSCTGIYVNSNRLVVNEVRFKDKMRAWQLNRLQTQRHKTQSYK